MAHSFHCAHCLQSGTLIHYSAGQKQCAVCGTSPLFKTGEVESELPTVDTILNDPACSHWLRNSLVSALRRDPVDAANDAELLARLLDSLCEKPLRAPTRE